MIQDSQNSIPPKQTANWMATCRKRSSRIWHLASEKEGCKEVSSETYINTLKSITRNDTLQQANDYLKDAKRHQSGTAFLRKYWVIKYWAEYIEKEETIYEIEKLKL